MLSKRKVRADPKITRLRIVDFTEPSNPLAYLATESPLNAQARYLQHYLNGLGCVSVIIEDAYFDRDYLSEFSAFYGVSSRGYPNRCSRLHFFSEPIKRADIRSSAGGSKRAARKLQRGYLGFVVLRPIPAARLGRTVLKAYPDRTPTTPRVTEAFRRYECHVAGVTLSVEGLAWQQQDTGVGACATIALWSLFHTSAFDDHHAIPTTADITRSAHKTASLGRRVFPSTGLTIEQLCEVIKEVSLAPVILPGNVRRTNGRFAFLKDRFSSGCASFLRSGYPVLLSGELFSEPRKGEEPQEGGLVSRGLHAVCAVGFRESSPPVPTAGTVDLQDEGVPFLYVHDDNVGPAVKMTISSRNVMVWSISGKEEAGEVVSLRPAPDRHTGIYEFIPSQILAAVHDDMRTSPDQLHLIGLTMAKSICDGINELVQSGVISGPKMGLTLSTRFVKLHRYLGEELAKVLSSDPALLGRVRLDLQERVPPMSLHVGVVRIGWSGTPLLDIVHDTTDSDRNLPPFCTVAYDRVAGVVAQALEKQRAIKLGTVVEAF